MVAAHSTGGLVGGPGKLDRDLVFQSVRSGKPTRDNNILARFIKPAARVLGLPWVNWRSLRTSHATWLKMAGADVKDPQAQMRLAGIDNAGHLPAVRARKSATSG
jgi:integrase